VLGLGVSYAMAGSKTLLIDLDLIGGGLTRRAEIQARARLGNLLIGQGLVTDEQLQRALELAQNKQIKLGEAFVEAGYLNRDQLDAILVDQKRSHAGLKDALYGKPLEECVAGAGMNNLDILPLGSANPHDAATLSPAEIKSLIEEAKTQYDTILIDTGPVPGSLEASMVASMTDGVLMIVARGEPRAGAENSLDHLRRVGGRVVGLVFNRAKPSDAGIAGGSMYDGGTSLRVSPDRIPTPAARQAASTRFGPVGQAVLDLVPSNRSRVAHH
jgi:polysaccharide biosynthesis transport protein